ncbi:MAG TPA: aminotransferase class IV [Polyangiaceae bacterium]|jgi:branched-chain amino acid aminotransferase
MSGPGRAIMIDGVLREPADATVSVYDRGFLYGDAVFEVLRTYGGKPFALDEHLARLRRSAERVHIALPVDESTLRDEIAAAIEAGGNDESYVRVVVTRGTGPLSLDPDTATQPLRVVLVDRVVPPPKDVYARGIALVTAHARRPTDDTAASGAKVTNYLANLLALREAKLRGAQEALLVDAREHVVEGASSNVFIVEHGRLATPPESAGILAGITRAHILAAARDLRIPVEEREVSLHRLYRADEVFITSSIREVLPVVLVDGRTIGAGVPGPVSRALHRRFRDAAGMAGRPMPYDGPGG